MSGTGLELVYRSDRRDKVVPSRVGGWFVIGYDWLDTGAGVVVTGEGDVRTVRPIAGAKGELLVPSADGATVSVFDAKGLHSRTVDAFTGINLVRYRHDEGRLVEIAGRSGPATTIQRDEQGRPLAFVAGGGARTGVAVDQHGWLAATADSAGTGWTMAYAEGGDGLLVRLIDGAGAGPTFTYDDKGYLATSVDADGVRTTWSGSVSDGEAVVVAKTPSGATTTWTDRRTDGERTITVERSGGARVVEAITDDGSSHVVFGDGTEVRRRLEPDPRWEGAVPRLAATTVATPSGRSVTVEQSSEIVVARDDRLTVATASRVTKRGEVRATVQWDGAERVLTDTDPAGVATRVRLDIGGHEVERTVGGRASVRSQRDATGAPIAVDDGRGITRIAYPDDAPEAVLTDPLGRDWRVAVDGVGRESAVLDPDRRRVVIERSAGGRPVAVTADGRQVHGSAWTPAGRPAGRNGPYAEVIDHDGDGRVATVRSGRDGEVTVGYDTAGEVDSLELQSGAVTFDRTRGRVSTASEASGVEVVVESDGPLVGRVTTSGPISGSVGHSYDHALQLVGLDLAGMVVSISRDAPGRVVAVGELAITWNDTGGVAGTELGRVSSRLTYDDIGDFASETWNIGGTASRTLSVTRDALGRASSETTVKAAGDSTRAFTYDAAGRLLKAAQGPSTWTYGWDRRDNLTSISGPTGPEELTYDGRDRLVTRGQTTYSWRDDGALVGWTTPAGQTSVAVDELGRTVGAKLPDGRGIAYLLDGGGRRVARQVDGVLDAGYLYDDGDTPVALVDPDGRVAQRYVRTDTNAPAFILAGDATYRVVSDRRGSPRVVIDAATGQVVQEIDYDPLGKITRDTNPGFQPFGFGGGLADPDTGLVHLGAREYDPATGRFTTPDPSPLAGAQLNPYVFGDGDPVNRIDPRGLQASPADGDPSAGFPDTGAFIDGVLNGGPPSQGVIRAVTGAGEIRSGFGPASAKSPASGIGSAGRSLGKASEYGLRGGSSLQAAGRTGARGLGALGGALGIARVVRDHGAGSRGGNVIDDVRDTGRALRLVSPWAARGFGLVYSAYVFGKLAPEAFDGTGEAGGSVGDPHLRTHDGLWYDFQGAGEFVLVRSVDGAAEVQVRQEPPSGARMVTINTAVAMRLGGRVVGVASDGSVRVDGQEVHIPAGVMSLNGGTQLRRSPTGELIVVAPDRALTVGILRHSTLDVRVAVGRGLAGQVRGLLGDAGGDPANDLTSAAGELVDPKTAPGATADDPLYATFGDSWRVSATSSLFGYAPGTDTGTFTDRSVPQLGSDLDTVDKERREAAETVCRGAGVSSQPFLNNCTLDIGVLDDPSFALSALRAQALSAVAAQTAGLAQPAPTATAAPGAPPAPASTPGGGTPLKVGDEAAGEIRTRDDITRFRFPGRQGEVIVIVPISRDNCDLRLSVTSPTGQRPLVDIGVCEGAFLELDSQGEHLLTVRTTGRAGPFRFGLQPAPAQVVRELPVGAKTQQRLSAPGDRHEYTFSGDVGDTVFLSGRSPSCDVALVVTGPDTQVVSRGSACLGVGRIILTQRGTHRIVISAPITFTGDYQLSLERSSPDQRFNIAVGDTVTSGRPGPGAGELDRPGARDIYVFDTPANQNLALRGTGPACFGARPRLGDDFITGLLSTCGDWTFTAPKAGKVELVIEGGDPPTGHYSFRLEPA